MYMITNLHNGLYLTFNPHIYDYINQNNFFEDDEEIIDYIEGESLGEFLKRMKDKIIAYVVNSKLIKKIIQFFAATPTLPDVIAFSVIKYT